MSKSNKGAPGFVEQLGDRLQDGGGRPAPLGVPQPPPGPPGPPSPIHQQVTVPPSAPGPQPPPALTPADDAPLPPVHSRPPVSDIQPVPPPQQDPFAEFEDPLDGESTRIDAEHLIAEESTTILQTADERPYLHVERGKDEGKEFVIGTGETSVGRSIDNDVILTDIAVSRRHMLMYIDPQGQVHVKDLGSGNGTQVNGNRIHDIIAADGDRVEIGETTLVVRMPTVAAAVAGVSPSPAARLPGESTDNEIPATGFPQPPTTSVPGGLVPSHATDYIPSPMARMRGIPRMWLMAFMIVGGLIVALLGATFTALILQSDEPGASQVSGDPGVQTRYVEGVNAMEAGDYDGAVRAFQEVVGMEPGNEGAREWLQRAESAQSQAQQVAEARSVLEQNPASARRLVADVRPDSPLYEQAQEIRRQAERAEVRALVSRVSVLIEDGDLEDARSALREAQTLAPDDEAVRELAEQLDEAGSRGAASLTVAVAEPQPAMVTMRTSSRATRTPRSSMRRTSVMTTPMRTTMRASTGGGAFLGPYRSGDFAGAARAARRAAESANSAEARRLNRSAQDIERFARAFANVRRGNASLSQLQQAMSLDRRISGGHYATRIQGPLVNAHLRAADAAFGRNDYARGCPSVRSALAVTSNARAQGMARQCEQRARAMMTRARGLERSNAREARNLYNQIMRMVPQSSSTYRDAYRRKNSLAAQRDEDE